MQTRVLCGMAYPWEIWRGELLAGLQGQGRGAAGNAVWLEWVTKHTLH